MADYNNQRVQKICCGQHFFYNRYYCGWWLWSRSLDAAQFNNPEGVTVDGAGNVYVADYGNFTVFRNGLPGSSSSGVTVAGGNGPGSAANQIYYPSDVKVDGDGNIYVLEEANHRVQKFPARQQHRPLMV